MDDDIQPGAEVAIFRTPLSHTSRVLNLARRLWAKKTFRLCLAAACALGLGMGAARMFIGTVYVVEGTSMEPTYPEGTSLYGAPITTPLARGDVIVLDDRHEDFAVKRIIGLPGETVQLWRGQVFINRQMLIEPYLPRHTYTYPAERSRRGSTVILGEDEYFVLGDNRDWSSDSRAYGPITRSQIKRRVPLPDDFVGAYFGPYTLPDYGQTLIRLNPHQYAGSQEPED